MYESDITQFLKKLKAERPHIEEGQRQGRALLWDRPPTDLDNAQRNQASRVPMKPYPYQTKS